MSRHPPNPPLFPSPPLSRPRGPGEPVWNVAMPQEREAVGAGTGELRALQRPRERRPSPTAGERETRAAQRGPGVGRGYRKFAEPGTEPDRRVAREERREVETGVALPGGDRPAGMRPGATMDLRPFRDGPGVRQAVEVRHRDDDPRRPPAAQPV